MTNLEKMRKEAEYMRVKASRMEQQVKIAEKEEEIERLRAHIEIQMAKENELQELLK